MVSYSLILVVEQTERKRLVSVGGLAVSRLESLVVDHVALITRNDLSSTAVDRIVVAKHSVLALVGSLHGVRVCSSLGSSVVGTV